MRTQPSEIYELSKITKMAVYYSGNQIVFLIKIPLVTELELTLYKILPIPHRFNKNHSIVLKPEFQYVGITKNRRQFKTFTETQLLSCTETELFNICPEFQPIQYESVRQPCEISLFKNPEVLPNNCEAGVIIITKNIYHKLKYSNTWLYTTINDTLTITCQRETEPYILKIQSQGLIYLNQDCRAYANDIVLNPTREIKSKFYVNFIPKLSEGSLAMKIPKAIPALEMPKYKHKNDLLKLDNIHELAHSLDDIQLMVENELDRQNGHVQTNHHYLIYAIIGLLLFSFILILILYVMYKCNMDLKRTYRSRPVQSKEYYMNEPKNKSEPKSMSTFYRSENIELRPEQSYETQRPLVKTVPYESASKSVIREEIITDTPDRLSINTNLPSVIGERQI